MKDQGPKSNLIPPLREYIALEWLKNGMYETNKKKKSEQCNRSLANLPVAYQVHVLIQ
jgi:hypothetical protein